jgi:shikimate kinase
MKIFLIGFMGCGKSHWGRLLSEKLRVPFIDLDEKIEESKGKSVSEIFAREGEEHFRMLEKQILHQFVETHESFVMATGGGTPCFFNNIDYLKRNGVVIWLNASIDTLYARLEEEKDKRPLISNISGKELRAFILKRLSGRKIFYEQANIIMSEGDITLENIVRKLFRE